MCAGCVAALCTCTEGRLKKRTKTDAETIITVYISNLYLVFIYIYNTYMYD